MRTENTCDFILASNLFFDEISVVDNAENSISEMTLDFKIFSEEHAPRPLERLAPSALASVNITLKIPFF